MERFITNFLIQVLNQKLEIDVSNKVGITENIKSYLFSFMYFSILTLFTPALSTFSTPV